MPPTARPDHSGRTDRGRPTCRYPSALNQNHRVISQPVARSVPVGQAIFLEVARDQLDPEAFPLDEADRRCVPQPNGAPKNSVYLSIYRALEHVPLAALLKLYLVTDDGRVLAVAPRTFEPAPPNGTYLYQEFCPVTPRVISRLTPDRFAAELTDESNPSHVPRLVFCDLTLGDLKNNPASPHVDDLPYPNIGHLRDCLRDLRAWPTKKTKTVLRQLTQDVARTGALRLRSAQMTFGA